MLSAIILAAGESSRMGSTPKPLLKFGGRTFADVIVEKLGGAGAADIVVVLGARATDIKKIARLENAKAVINENWREGQLSSLRAGVASLGPDSEGFLLNPCDCPAVRPETYAAIVAAWRADKSKIFVPTHQDRGGHPSIFPRDLYAEILEGELAEGAKTVLKKHSSRVTRVETSDKGILGDVDTMEDYEKFLREASA